MTYYYGIGNFALYRSIMRGTLNTLKSFFSELKKKNLGVEGRKHGSPDIVFAEKFDERGFDSGKYARHKILTLVYEHYKFTMWIPGNAINARFN